LGVYLQIVCTEDVTSKCVDSCATWFCVKMFLGGSDVLVSIISVVFNREDTIAKAIESVLNQTYDNIEYIIVDGASTDSTLEIARSFIPVFRERPGRELRIISEPDEGMYDALNKGIRAAHGEIIGNINSDDWYELEAVEKMVDFYRKNCFDVAWGNIRIIMSSGSFVKKARIGKLWTSSGFCHPSMFARREILLEYPYACESMFDDFDFVTRVFRAGKKICLLDDLIANFVFGGMGNTKRIRDVFARIRGRYAFYKKHGFSPFYWFYCFAIEMAKFILG